MTERLLELDDRTFVVAGAGGGGIGTATCAAIVLAGGRVIAIDNNLDRLEMVARLARVTPRLADARDLVAVERVLATEGPVDGLVHVAGGLRVDQWERTEDLRLSSFDDVIANNLRSALVTSRVVATRLIATGSPGSIVHVSSVAVLGALPYGAAYAVAKAGMLALMRTQAVEWGPRGIRVNAVAPGSVATPGEGRVLTRRGGRPPHPASPARRARRCREPRCCTCSPTFRASLPGTRSRSTAALSVRPGVSRRHGSPGVRTGRRLRPRLVR